MAEKDLKPGRMTLVASTPGWNASARAAITGLSLDTSPLEILRAGLESIAFRFGLLHEIMTDVLPPALQIIASGGALLNSPTWMQIIADVLNRPVTASEEGETTSRGAALLALEQLGAFGSFTTALSPAGGPDNAERNTSSVVRTAYGSLSQARFDFGRTFQPNPARHTRYTAAMERQKQLYEVLIRQNTV